MTAPEFTRMVTVSTAHVTEETANMLEKASHGDLDLPTMTVYEKKFNGTTPVGYFIYLCVKPEQIDPNGLPEDLVALVNLAKFCGAGMVCLDGDGPEVEGLPSYCQDFGD